MQYRKQIIEQKQQIDFEQSLAVRETLRFGIPPILSTGGYNDTFLRFVAQVFQNKILKCSSTLGFVVKAIDYINRTTNDCFFKLIGPVNMKINETGKIDQSLKPNKHFFSLKESLYPYLLVNLRSGATFHVVESKDKFRRVCGTTIGVSFAVGILRYMDMFQGPTEMCEAARNGDSSKIDMSVGDIYGNSAYEGVGLGKNMIASSFGRLKDASSDEISENISAGDISRSLITLIAANNLIFSRLVAKMENIKRVVWIGSHIDLPDYMHMSEQGFARLTNQEAELIFPTYTSFLGSLGLLLSQSNF